ncbi:unnamed protein product [Amoebophrya sp. A120]|nr:unnamed protein product [Amoebophrya sp. A120]|eukprot:GSA120T00021177001.1
MLHPLRVFEHMRSPINRERHLLATTVSLVRNLLLQQAYHKTSDLSSMHQETKAQMFIHALAPAWQKARLAMMQDTTSWSDFCFLFSSLRYRTLFLKEIPYELMEILGAVW